MWCQLEAAKDKYFFMARSYGHLVQEKEGIIQVDALACIDAEGAWFDNCKAEETCGIIIYYFFPKADRIPFVAHKKVLLR
jgi:hypothetical protein